MNTLLFGTSGIPISTPDKCRSTQTGIQQVNKLGLDAMELEFVQSVNIKIDKAPAVKKTAEENNVALTCHGQYFINLAAFEQHKIKASIQRILNAATVADACGSYSMTFHPAFYQKQDPQKVYGTVKKHMKDVMRQVKDSGLSIWVRPETTGKPTQFGDLKELCNLSAEFDQVLPCIDFAHLHARTGGNLNTKNEFHEMLSFYEKTLGKTALKNMHIHLAGINYSDKGERNHLPLQESDMNYKDLLKTLHEFGCAGVLICESPNIEKDALLLKKYYQSL
ncbi:TIM barrel protein [Candidatus Woesearchaeota archaeon]|nr:TIM barrel protein [Candidatus Woesearchaeota archaeon]